MWAESKLGLKAIRSLARIGAWADRRNVDLRLEWNLMPEDSWPAGDVAFVLRAHNTGGMPVTVERLGLLSLDRVLSTKGLSAARRIDEATWTRDLARPTLLERGGRRAEIKFSIEDLAKAGFSLRTEMLAPIAFTADARLRVGELRDHLLLLSPRLDELVKAAEQRGQAFTDSKPMRNKMLILGVRRRMAVRSELQRIVDAANKQRQGERAR